MSNPRLGLPSASGAKRRRACLGSFLMESATAPEDYPVLDPSLTMSEEGDLLHESWESDDPSKLSADQKSTYYHGKRLRSEAITIAEEEGLEQPWSTIKEKRVWLTLDGERALSGRFDELITDEKHMLVMDWKAGWLGAGDASENPQLLELALILYFNFPEVEWIMVALLQPKLPKEEQLTYWIWKAAELKKEMHKLIEHLYQIHEPDNDLNQGDWCKYCKALRVCPMHNRVISEIDQKQYLSKVPDVRQLNIYKAVERFIAQQRLAAVNALMNDPDAIPGVTLNKPRVTRKYDSAEVIKRLLNHLDDGTPLIDSTDDLIDHVDITITQLNSIIREKLELKGANVNKKVNEIFGDLFTESQSRPSLKLLE